MQALNVAVTPGDDLGADFYQQQFGMSELDLYKEKFGWMDKVAPGLLERIAPSEAESRATSLSSFNREVCRRVQC